MAANLDTVPQLKIVSCKFEPVTFMHPEALKPSTAAQFATANSKLRQIVIKVRQFAALQQYQCTIFATDCLFFPN
jgi:hypothetical protein